MTTNRTIDGVPRELLERCARVVRKPRDETVRRRALSELRALLDTERCTSCDGSGDLVDLTGEWRGYCVCPIGVALKNKPAAQPQGEPVSMALKYLARVLDEDQFNTVEDMLYAEQPAPVAVPEGWQLVPIEPTERMIRRGDQNYSWSVAKIYAAMIEAAPACLDKVKELNQ